MTNEDLELIKYFQSIVNTDSEYQKALNRMIAYCELCLKLESEV